MSNPEYMLDALRDVVSERGWQLVRKERDVYTAELVGQRLSPASTGEMVTPILAFEEGRHGTESTSPMAGEQRARA